MVYHARMSAGDGRQVEVRELTDRSALKAFIRVPWSVYRCDPYWVPPLLMERREALSPKNPFFRHAEWQGWIAWRGGRPVGRISAQIDRLYHEYHDAHTGFFGMLEAEDDAAVFSALFAAAEGWLRSRGMQHVLGPFNLGINQEMGLLVEGFDSPPFIMMGHGRPYYGRAVEALAYAPAQDTLAYVVETPQFAMPEKVRRLLARNSQRIRERAFDRRQRHRDLGIMRDIFNDAWSGNWGFVPFTEAEFEAAGKELLMLLPDEFIRIAEVDGEPAAFIVLLPNLNEAIADLNGHLLPLGWAKLLWRLKVRFPKTARIPLMGVRRRYQNTRLGPALAFLAIAGLEAPGRARGIERTEMSWILEDNQGVRNIIETMGGTVTKRYRMYRKELGPVNI
jgi:hypothetical protein